MIGDALSRHMLALRAYTAKTREGALPDDATEEQTEQRDAHLRHLQITDALVVELLLILGAKMRKGGGA
jgi:hypothetical protein